jgi:hypothetical protein
LCHHVNVTGEFDAAFSEFPPPLSLEPHAAAATAAVPATTARTPRDPILRMSVLSS